MITRIYTKDYVVLDYDSSIPCVVATNLKFVLPEEFKSFLNFGLDFIIEEHAKTTERILWLADVKLSPVFDADVIQWIAGDWTPRMLAAGVSHFAFVLPDSEWAMGGVNDFSDESAKKGLTIANFAEVEAAKKWYSELTEHV